MFKSTYRESVSPVPAAESRRLAMVDGVSIVLDHAKRYDTPRALWASMLVAALTSWKASDRFACGGEHQGWIIPVGNLSIRYFAYYIILGINTPRIIALGFTLTHAAPACLVRECVGGSYCTGWSKCRSPTRSRSPTILPPHPIHVCAPETPLTLRCNR